MRPRVGNTYVGRCSEDTNLHWLFTIVHETTSRVHGSMFLGLKQGVQESTKEELADHPQAFWFDANGMSYEADVPWQFRLTRKTKVKDLENWRPNE